MFETAELGRSISKKEFKARVADLRVEMLRTQFGLRETPHSVIVLISGVDGAGKGEVVNRLNEWFDSREHEVHAYGVPSDEERERPRFWRFWRTLPPRGRIGILFGSWYTQPIVDRVQELIDEDHLDAEMHRITRFERMLVEDGTIVVKLWFHLSRDAQEKRFKELEADKHQAWRVTPQDWKNFEHYDAFRRVCERALRQSDKSFAPWMVIESADPKYRDITAAESILGAIHGRLENPRVETEAAAVHPGRDGELTILDSVDLDAEVEKSKYEKELTKLQAEINKLTWRANKAGISTLCVFAAPTEEERAQHYLWRFWRHVPRAGSVTIYDRSWYGRVLVERVEGFAPEDVWRRAYSEINEFEEQMTEANIVICKFWLHIDKDEQERRFKEREKIAHKKHKLTEEDWRNRERWDDYREAVDEMVSRTSTEFAPWTLVPANDKYFARLEVLRTVVTRLKEALR
jgi:polyphosphate kinase 2 (PPK2 family)